MSGRVEITLDAREAGAVRAYWCGAQSDRFVANANASIGSIGVFAAIEDTSGRGERLGVKVHLIKAGEYKGAGVPGTAVTDKMVAEWQRSIDTIYGQFINAVSSGRKMAVERVKALADGRVHIGQEAVRLGLIDRVSSLDETLADLRNVVVGRTVSAPTVSKGPNAMTTENWGAPVAATVRELREVCPNASSDFILSQLEAGATTMQALAAYNGQLQNRLATNVRPGGVVPPKVNAVADHSAHVGDWEDAIAAELAANPRMNKAQAISAVNRKFPGLREQYVAQYNREHGRAAVA